ncbi:ATPase [Mycolicibacterium agri]|uniref:ATPase n=1 Tax=Mycolicibacterium agri TaxID=36811 RepID=A0A2A7N3E3_MYCAG|nr:SRPBCC family protein [Mycolicibacterium agri]PEG38416.1 ATPase [Mycolicibacterium agri]GFG53864.1 ATPase [Mycolicibacterium agri]
MTIDVEVHTTIERARPQVARYCCDPDNITAWCANIQAVHWETPPPLDVGTRIRLTSGFLGRTVEHTSEVAELVAGELLVMRSLLTETTYRWTDSDEGGTWMTVRNRGEPTAYPGLAAPIIATAIRRATANDLDRLKSILEAR